VYQVVKYRKRPIEIEAFRWRPNFPGGHADMPSWLFMSNYELQGDSLLIKTPEGTMRADPGDWIIRGVKGEIYPCKPDIFEATYEPA